MLGTKTITQFQVNYWCVNHQQSQNLNLFIENHPILFRNYKTEHISSKEKHDLRSPLRPMQDNNDTMKNNRYVVYQKVSPIEVSDFFHLFVQI